MSRRIVEHVHYSARDYRRSSSKGGQYLFLAIMFFVGMYLLGNWAPVVVVAISFLLYSLNK